MRYFGSSYNINGNKEGIVCFPKMIPALINIKSVAFLLHALCLDNEGNVYAFGCNRHGKYGIGVDEDVLTFTHIPQKVNLPPCIQVACGYTFSMCLTNDGAVYSFGNNFFGQLPWK